jgi:hypothetical protein
LKREWLRYERDSTVGKVRPMNPELDFSPTGRRGPPGFGVGCPGQPTGVQKQEDERVALEMPEAFEIELAVVGRGTVKRVARPRSGSAWAPTATRGKALTSTRGVSRRSDAMTDGRGDR